MLVFFSEVSVVILSFVVWKPKFKKSTKKKEKYPLRNNIQVMLDCLLLIVIVCLFVCSLTCLIVDLIINFICFFMFFLLVYFIWIYIECLFLQRNCRWFFFLLSLVIWIRICVSSRFESEWLSVANSENTPRFFHLNNYSVVGKFYWLVGLWWLKLNLHFVFVFCTINRDRITCTFCKITHWLIMLLLFEN